MATLVVGTSSAIWWGWGPRCVAQHWSPRFVRVGIPVRRDLLTIRFERSRRPPKVTEAGSAARPLPPHLAQRGLIPRGRYLAHDVPVLHYPLRTLDHARTRAICQAPWPARPDPRPHRPLILIASFHGKPAASWRPLRRCRGRQGRCEPVQLTGRSISKAEAPNMMQQHDHCLGGLE